MKLQVSAASATLIRKDDELPFIGGARGDEIFLKVHLGFVAMALPVAANKIWMVLLPHCFLVV